MFGFKRDEYEKIAIATVVMRSVTQRHITMSVPVTFEQSIKGKRRLKIAENGTWYKSEIESMSDIYFWLEGGPLPTRATAIG